MCHSGRRPVPTSTEPKPSALRSGGPNPSGRGRAVHGRAMPRLRPHAMRAANQSSGPRGSFRSAPRRRIPGPWKSRTIPNPLLASSATPTSSQLLQRHGLRSGQPPSPTPLRSLRPARSPRPARSRKPVRSPSSAAYPNQNPPPPPNWPLRPNPPNPPLLPSPPPPPSLLSRPSRSRLAAAGPALLSRSAQRPALTGSSGFSRLRPPPRLSGFSPPLRTQAPSHSQSPPRQPIPPRQRTPLCHPRPSKSSRPSRNGTGHCRPLSARSAVPAAGLTPAGGAR